MWAVGRYDLRLPEGAFWRTTPREFHALLERRNDATLRADWRVAVAVIHLLSPWMTKGTKVQPADIFPNLPQPREGAANPRVWYPGAKKR